MPNKKSEKEKKMSYLTMSKDDTEDTPTWTVTNPQTGEILCRKSTQEGAWFEIIRRTVMAEVSRGVTHSTN